MMFRHIAGFFWRPRREWERVEERELESPLQPLLYVAVMALLPALAWYHGTTRVGWQIGDGSPIRLTTDSAQIIVVLFYFTQIIAVVAIGYMIHWMSHTYGANSSTTRGITLTALAATPLFVAGLVGVYPIFWLDLLIGTLAVCYAVYLLYQGIPIVMSIPEERGFLFSSAVVAVGLVAIMIIMGGTVILWDWGAAPRFTD